MKQYLILAYVFVISFLINGFEIKAQDNITVAFNSVHTGRNLSMTYSKRFNRHRIIGGIKYNINSLVQDDQNELFKKRFYATNFEEHWGLVLGYKYSLKKLNAIEPYFFYDVQFTNSHTRNKFVTPVAQDENGTFYYVKRLVFMGPTIALDNYIGLGIDIPLFDNLLISQKVGFGGSFYFNTDPGYVFENNRSQEFGYMLSIGVSYTFKGKN